MTHTYYYENLELRDIENEIWVDVYGFDGIYEVSNFGRIKSLEREVPSKNGGTRVTKEIIMKQSVTRKKNGSINSLIVSLGRKSRSAQLVVYPSFYPETYFKKNECIAHKNKNCLDNELNNLIKTTRKKSKNIDMVLSKKTIKATTDNLKKAINSNKMFYDNRVKKQCSACGKIDLKENFPLGLKCQRCINTYVSKRKAIAVYSLKLKKCNSCKAEKIDNEFHKLSGTCKVCDNERHQAFVEEQTKNIGDWYVKQYGKMNHKIKYFTQDIIDHLRLEIIDKRKPKFFLDDMEFTKKSDFAKYVEEKYKIPKTTVVKRLEGNCTEIQCTLNRSDFTKSNITT